jgi:anti-sigma regulatory factor (Ser/Thr protein kinase)/DNA-binding NarL/FixJ family response regulator
MSVDALCPEAPADRDGAVALSRVVIVGDDAEDLAQSTERLTELGYRSRDIDLPGSQSEAEPPPRDVDCDIEVVGAALNLGEIEDYLNARRSQRTGTRATIIVQTRHLTAADRRKLIKSGAHYLLAMPVSDAILHRIVRTALADAATADSIQDFISSHKSAIGRMVTGVFEIQTLDEAQKLSTMLATHYPVPDLVVTGIWELLSNAVEHGNLEIDFDQKMDLLERGIFQDEITRRLGTPKYAGRVARVEFERAADCIRLRVTDQGQGFDYEKFLAADIPMNRPNGRGIFIAGKLCFEQLKYSGKGNIVEGVISV